MATNQRGVSDSKAVPKEDALNTNVQKENLADSETAKPKVEIPTTNDLKSADAESKAKKAGDLKESSEETETLNRGQKRKLQSEETSKETEEAKKQALASEKRYQKFANLTIDEYYMKELDYPRADPSGQKGAVKLYGSRIWFKKGQCKRCSKNFDTSFARRERCDFHKERSKKFNGRQHPHGCCGRKYGSRGCHTAPSHVYEGNLYYDLTGYKSTAEHGAPKNHNVYALDAESIHTKKGLEVCRVTVIDEKLQVVYNEFCLPTTEIIDYNTIWSGITKKDLDGVTKTFEEMQNDVLKLFSADTILVGHGLNHDLSALKIVHDKVIDTLVIYPHPRGWPLKRSLKDIAGSVLGITIQNRADGHDSKEDAVVAMKLVLKKIPK